MFFVVFLVLRQRGRPPKRLSRIQGPKRPKNVPKWPKMASKSKNFRSSVSARNALKWHPNGLKRSQNTFIWPFDPLLAALGWFPPAGPKRAQKGGQKAIKMCFGTVLYHLDAILLHFEPKPKIEIFSILRPFWAILGLFWPLFWPSEFC